MYFKTNLKKNYPGVHKIAKSSATVFNLDHNKCLWAPNHQHIRLISEGSCDSNDAENSALHHKNMTFYKYIHIGK